MILNVPITNPSDLTGLNRQLEVADPFKRPVFSSLHHDSAALPKNVPKTKAEVVLSPSNGSLNIDWFRVQELIKFDLNARLGADLGFLLYTRGGMGHARILPRLRFQLYPDCTLTGTWGTNSSYLGITKAYKFGSVSFYAGLVNKKKYIQGSLTKNFSNGLSVKARVSTSSLKFQGSKNFDNLRGKCVYEENSIKSSPGFYIHRTLSEGVSIVLGTRLELNKRVSVCKTQVGVRLDLSKFAAVCYYIENVDNQLYWRTVVKRGQFKLDLSLRLKSFNRVLAYIGIIVASYATKALYDYFNPKESASDENESIKKASLEYTNMIREKALAIKNEEQAKQGLYITQALYGNRESIEKILSNPGFSASDVVDVTVPLNFLIENSTIRLPSGPKSQLQGFYEVCNPSVLYIALIKSNTQFNIFLKDAESFYI